MKTKNNTAITIGLDLGDRKHSVCVLGAGGEVIKQETITNNRACLTVLSRRHPGALMVMEVGMHSPWISRFLKNLGHRVTHTDNRRSQRRGDNMTAFLEAVERWKIPMPCVVEKP